MNVHTDIFTLVHAHTNRTVHAYIEPPHVPHVHINACVCAYFIDISEFIFMSAEFNRGGGVTVT